MFGHATPEDAARSEMALEVSEPEQFWNGKLVLSWIDSLIFMPPRALQLSPLTPAPELQAIVSKPCDSEDAIDDALREYLSLTTQHKGDKFEPRTPGRSARTHDRSLTLYIVVADELLSENDISRCSYKLFASEIFAAHADYVRRQIIYGLLQVLFFFSFVLRPHDLSLEHCAD